MQAFFCNIQFSAIFCLAYSCLTIPHLGKTSRPTALKIYCHFQFNNLMVTKLNAFYRKDLSRKHESLFLNFGLWIWWRHHYSCVYEKHCFFYISNMWNIDSWNVNIFQNKELFCYVMFPLSVTHVFYGLDLINYKIFQFCVM